MSGNNRNLAILGVILLVLAVGYWFSTRSRPALDPTAGWQDVVEGTLSTDEIYGLEVYRGGAKDQGFTLARQGDEWVMPSRWDAPANMNRLRTLLGNLEQLEGEFRSDDPSVLGDYGLADSSAVHLVLKDEAGDPLLHLLLGKPSGAGCFLRREGSDTVLLGSRNLLSDFGIWGEDNRDPVAANWLDLEVFTPDRSSVTGIVLEPAEGRAIEMEKEFAAAEGDTTAPDPNAYEWKVTRPESFTALKTRADGILTTLTNLRARDVAPPTDDPAAYGLGETADRVEVVQDDGTRTVLLFGAPAADETEGTFYFQVEGKERIWLMADYVRGNVFKSVDELRPQ